MSLTPVQRELLLDGPHGWGKKQDVVKAFGGPCQIITAWRKHRAELMAACPMGKRLLELDLCRDSAERAHCKQRLGEIAQRIRYRRKPPACTARKLPTELPTGQR